MTGTVLAEPHAASIIVTRNDMYVMADEESLKAVNGRIVPK